MTRRVRRVALAIVVLLVAGAVALLFVGRSRLDDARTEVDTTWKPLRTPLAERYLKLAAVDTAFRDAGAGNRVVAGDLERLLEQWGRQRNADEPDAEAEVEVANGLEGAARRVIAASASPRLLTNEPLQSAITEFRGAAIPAPALKTYNDAVRDYQNTREGFLWAPTARLFGYDARPVLTPGQ
jgi:hypothetical protein